jgi:hypothetical protein
MTSTSWSAIVSTHVACSDTAGKLFVGPQTPEVGPHRVNGRGQAVEDSEPMKDAKDDLKAHSAVAAFDSHQRLAIDAGAVGQLVLRQAAELAPRLHMAADVAQHAPDRNRRG